MSITVRAAICMHLLLYYPMQCLKNKIISGQKQAIVNAHIFYSHRMLLPETAFKVLDRALALL